MVKHEKLRSEILDEHKWDLSAIYKSDEQWQIDYNKLEKELTKFKKYQGKILDSPEILYKVISLLFNTNRSLDKLQEYATRNRDVDTSDDNYQTLAGKIMNLYQKLSEESSFIEPELIKGSYKQIKDYYKQEPKLKGYDNYFKEVYRFKKHTLNESEEKLLSSLNKSLSMSGETYDKLVDTDLKLGVVKNDAGEDVILSDLNWSNFIYSPNREVRQNAYQTMFTSYGNFSNTIASTLAGEVEANVALSKIKKYPNAITMALYADDVSVEVYDNLINTVNNNLDKLYKYYKMRKDILKLDKLYWYDMYVDLLSKEETKKYSFEEAKDLVIKSLSVLGDDYIKNLNQAFDQKWIDIYSNQYKVSGAYSGGSYDTYPYILLNYQGKLDDVSTLAHELGHSLHSHYSRNNNPYQDGYYKIFVAEVASTVNELLLAKYMLKESNNKQEKLSILNKLIELLRQTIYRQTMFAEFESEIYKKSEAGEILTSKLLCDIYLDINKKYFKENVVLDDLIKYEWERISHFYRFFYVYKYATGLSAACYIVNNILENKPKALENYLEFLKLGGSKYPLESLMVAGVDMTDKKVVESALKLFDDLIDEFIEVYNS